MSVEIIEGDLADSRHAAGLVQLLDEYARDPIITGKPLPDDVREHLVERLQQVPGRLVLLAVDTGPDGNPDSDRIVGVAVCFSGFTTFRAHPLINIHDLVVTQDRRGQGIGRQLLDAVADQARARGCCRITLEVVSANPAKRLYERAGFEPAQEFWKRELY